MAEPLRGQLSPSLVYPNGLGRSSDHKQRQKSEERASSEANKRRAREHTERRILMSNTDAAKSKIYRKCGQQPEHKQR